MADSVGHNIVRLPLRASNPMYILLLSGIFLYSQSQDLTNVQDCDGCSINRTLLGTNKLRHVIYCTFTSQHQSRLYKYKQLSKGRNRNREEKVHQFLNQKAFQKITIVNTARQGDMNEKKLLKDSGWGDKNGLNESFKMSPHLT